MTLNIRPLQNDLENTVGIPNNKLSNFSYQLRTDFSLLFKIEQTV
jgi:hypothetical protein